MKPMPTRVLAAAGAAFLLATGTAAHARADVYWSIGVNAGPVYVAPAPVYVQPPPVYVAPAPVYLQPRPVVLVQQPVYYVQPAPVYYGHPGKRKGWHRHHRHNGWHD
jgi:hypothetical protein